MQGGGGNALADFVLKGLGQASQRPVVSCRDEFLKLLCLRFFFFHGSCPTGDGLGFQVLLLCPLFFQPSHAGEGDAEALCDLRSCLPALQGLNDALAKIGGESLHTPRGYGAECVVRVRRLPAFRFVRKLSILNREASRLVW